MLYVYAKLSKHDFGFFRAFGAGLGNLLFPWARSVVAAEKYGLKIIEPTWPQIKIGPILRREKDARLYNNFFSPLPGEIGGFKKIFLLASHKKSDESFLFNNKLKEVGGKSCIFVFEGMENFFQPVLKEHKLIRARLLQAARDEHKAGLKYDFRNCISLHIRRGEFKALKWDTSIEWFLMVMDELKNKFGQDIKFKIFSDGSDDELAPVLAQKNTEKLFFGSALADLLALSRSKVLVASANSTFSMWASYLGRMPTIWPKDGMSQVLHFEKPGNEIEIGRNGFLSDSFFNACKNAEYIE